MGKNQPSPPLLVAQITDLHLFADERRDLLGWNTWESLAVVVQQVMAQPVSPDLLLLTGDLAQDETEGAYLKVLKCFEPLGIPTYWLPGNHDHVQTMERVLNQPPIYIDKSIDQGGWRLLLLNTNVPGQVYGALSAETLDWLATQLAQTPPTQPTAIAMHHPPFLVGSPWLDKSGLQNTSAFLEVIDRFPQVQLVLFGHVHQEFKYVRQDVMYLSTPSTCIQFRPKSVNFALDDALPGFRLLWLYPDGQYKTLVHRVCFQQQLDLAAQGY
ncbi:MAG: 3',5'-cyclic-AMP phosphodiesterase [Thermosynechococcaceae cyanobacterium]